MDSYAVTDASTSTFGDVFFSRHVFNNFKNSVMKDRMCDGDEVKKKSQSVANILNVSHSIWERKLMYVSSMGNRFTVPDPSANKKKMSPAFTVATPGLIRCDVCASLSLFMHWQQCTQRINDLSFLAIRWSMCKQIAAGRMSLPLPLLLQQKHFSSYFYGVNCNYVFISRWANIENGFSLLPHTHAKHHHAYWKIYRLKMHKMDNQNHFLSLSLSLFLLRSLPLSVSSKRAVMLLLSLNSNHVQCLNCFNATVNKWIMSC